MSNELVVGTPRVGWLHHQKLPDPSHPAPCMLMDDGKQITVRVPLLPGTDDLHERWFHASFAEFGDDPDRTKFDYAAPETIAFVDHDGIVMLVGCSWSQSVWSGFGSEGVIEVRRAILGARDYRYPMINAMRSEISGLSDWMGLSGVDVKVDSDTEGRALSITIASQTGPHISLSPRLNFSVEATWRERPVTDGSGIEAPAEVKSQVAKPRPWDDHADLHRALLALIEISAWDRIGFRRMDVLRNTNAAGASTNSGSGWNRVVSHERDHKEASTPSDPRRFLFGFSDVGASGIAEWLRVRKTFQRGVQQMHAMLHQPGMFLEVKQANVGAALEAIGYILALEAGKSPASSSKESYAARLSGYVN